MSLLIKNAKIQEKNNFFIKNVFCKKGKIASITNPDNTKFNADKTIDAKGKLLLPGGIDCHVHFREPGMEKKGNWKSESRAAAAGGITSVIDMPNTIPSTTTVQTLKEKRKTAEKNSLINFGFHFGAEKRKLAEINKVKNIASIKVFMGSSTGNLLVEEEKILEEIFRTGKQKNILIVLHAEEEKIIKKNSKKAREKNWNNVKYHNKIRSEKAESEAIKKALKIQKKVGNRIHFLHVSTKKGMQEIIKAKKRTKQVSCEVCPHHLFLNEKDLNRLGNFGKMNPPLRTKKDNEFLMNALKKGLIDFIATDHAPHTKKEKQKNYFDAPSGVTGIETVYSLLLNEAAKGKIKLSKVIEVLCEKPAEVYGIKNKGKIKEGFDADLVLVDLNKSFTVKNSDIHSKCKWTPFNGRKLKGKIEATIINGNIVYNKGKINSKIKGKEVKFEKKK
ncbi:dihydroorotase [Candidatus Micrarchaeota archaeon]|nr:dihydroorotase [Candidatus Micrarchaeota archaeon]